MYCTIRIGMCQNVSECVIMCHTVSTKCPYPMESNSASRAVKKLMQTPSGSPMLQGWLACPTAKFSTLL